MQYKREQIKNLTTSLMINTIQPRSMFASIRKHSSSTQNSLATYHAGGKPVTTRALGSTKSAHKLPTTLVTTLAFNQSPLWAYWPSYSYRMLRATSVALWADTTLSSQGAPSFLQASRIFSQWARSEGDPMMTTARAQGFGDSSWGKHKASVSQGSGDSSVVSVSDLCAKDRGFESWQDNFFSWLLFQYLFHPFVITGAHQNPRHSAKSTDGRLQLTSHAPYVCGFA